MTTSTEHAGRCGTLEPPGPHTRRARGVAAPHRPQGRDRRATGFWIASITLLVVGAQGAAPSPIYPLYAREWHLTPFITTVIFAAYVVGTVVTLMTAGSLSDHIGRRPIVLSAAVIGIGALVLFALATGPWEVIVARLLQGVALALGITALGANLLDLSSPRRPHLAATLNGAIPPSGLAFGALTSSILVQYAPWPTVSVYVVYAAATVVMTALVFLVPQPHAPRPGALASLRPTIGIPRHSRPAFLTALCCLLAAWALGGLYLGLGSSVVVVLFGLHNALAGGAAIAAVTGTGAITGLALQRRSPATTMTIGAVALVIGPILGIVSILAPAQWLFYVSSVVGGVGFGAGFQGGLRLVLGTAPADRRAGLLSSIYVASYSAFAIPTLVAGLLSPHLGLKTVTIGFAIFVALLCTAALILRWRNSGRMA